jgi:hypothetical protein
MSNATQTALGGTKNFVHLTEQEPGIYSTRHPNCARRNKMFSMQLKKQESGIYAKHHPDCAMRHKTLSVQLTVQEPI